MLTCVFVGASTLRIVQCACSKPYAIVVYTMFQACPALRAWAIACRKSKALEQLHCAFYIVCAYYITLYAIVEYIKFQACPAVRAWATVHTNLKSCFSYKTVEPFLQGHKATCKKSCNLNYLQFTVSNFSLLSLTSRTLNIMPTVLYAKRQPL